MLKDGLTGPNALAAPYTFDVRGGGGWWGIEFEFEGTNLQPNQPFALQVQAKAMENGLVLMGLTGGANIEGTKGDHIMLSPAYNVTKNEIEEIARLTILSVEQSLRELQQ